VVEKNACSEKLWLALADGATCPKVREWETSPLFGASPARSRPGFPAHTFCRYESSREPSASAIAALQNAPNLHAAVHRCGVVGPAGSVPPPQAADPPASRIAATADPSAAADAAKLDEITRSKFARDFLYEVGATDLSIGGKEAPNVRLTVLDTVPTGEGVPDSLPAGCIDHGFGISHIAHQLACGDGGCAATLATRLAMPLPDAKATREMAGKTPCGGYGTPGDLAAAIRGEVDAWLAARRDKKNPQQRLILNLSLGWDPRILHEELGAVDPDDHLNAEELSVYDALAYAAENGALAIAAAGNLVGGKIPENGPTLPAGWDAFPPVITLLPPSDERVIWAVGGVDRSGRKLSNARPGSEPSLVTYGDHAVVKLGPGLWTNPLTGTSVSAAVASSVAALVWHLRPELSGKEVIDLLARSGSDLGRGAELFRPAKGSAVASTAGAATVPGVPIVPSAAGAPSTATAAGGANGALVPTPGETPPPVHRLDLSAALGAALAAKPGNAAANPIGCHLMKVAADKIPPGCAKRTYYTCDGVPPVCPGDTLASVASTGKVSPKPEANPCPSCSLGGGSGGRMALTILIDPAWSQGCLVEPMLEVESASGEQIGVSIPLAKNLCPGDALTVPDLDLPASLATARISFRLFNQNLSVQSAVYLMAAK
ncbi:MAG TPA: S8 family serine peptidase, partial [Thermoanaerobaculia bacterium]|nr:S8 family serine peptidase [Thermoanaerobaculia bacterium]